MRKLLLFLILGIVLTRSQAMAPAAASYVVRPGDTLSEIAAGQDMDVEALVDLNAHRYPSLTANPGRIQVGWTFNLDTAGRPAQYARGEDRQLLSPATDWMSQIFSRITHEPWPPNQLPPTTGLRDLFELGRGILCVGEASIITPLMFSPLSRPVEGTQEAAVERSAQEILVALYTYDDGNPAAWKRRASEMMVIEGRGQVLEELFLRRVLRPSPGSEFGNVQLLDLGLAQQMGGLFVLADVTFTYQRDGHTETEKVIIVMRRDLIGRLRGVLIL